MKKSKEIKKDRTKIKKNKPNLRLDSFKKYRAIITSVILFLIFNISILALNYYQSLRIDESTTKINLSAQQSGLIQDIAKNIIDINLITERHVNENHSLQLEDINEEIFKQINSLIRSSDLFGQTLEAFQRGKDINISDGSTVYIEPIQIESAIASLQRIQDVWSPYNGLLNNFFNDYNAGNIELDTIQFAADYARIYTTRLLNENDDITNALQDNSNAQTNLVRLIQIVGIIIAISIFFFIVFRALRQLLRSDAELAKSRRETTEIMNSIQEGLFLIDRDYIIGEQQSKQLGHIFPVKDISGKKLDEVLEGVVPEKNIENTKRFINQLFNRKVHGDLINDLNPLRRVMIQRKNENGSTETIYLSFQFVRSYEGKKIHNVLVSITDVTLAVELEQRLEKEREQSEMQFKMLVKLLRIDPTTLDSLMRNASKMAERINDILRDKKWSQSALKQKVNDIFREVHSFKGEASALELEGFVDIAESIENQLKALRERNQLSGNDFLGIALSLEQFYNLNQDIENMRNRLVNLNMQLDSNSSENISEYFKNFADKIAQRNQKEVQLQVLGFDDVSLDNETLDKIKEVTIQLLRNAIVHGCELPEVRQRLGKPAYGRVRIKLIKKNDFYEIIVEDDGGGILIEEIRKKLVKEGLYTQEQANNLQQRDLYQAIFTSGLSTAKESNEDAGRGVGMDVVKDRIQQLHGKINIRSEVGKYSQFIIRFPA